MRHQPHRLLSPFQAPPGLEGQAFYALDRQGRLRGWSAGAVELFGYQAHDVLGWHHHRLYESSPATPPPAHYRLLSPRSGGKLCYEGWLRGKADHPFWATVQMVRSPQAQTSPLHAPVIWCAVQHGSTTDHHQDRLAFQAALLNRVRNAILATDSQGRLIYMNTYAESLFGLSWDQIKGEYLKDLSLWPDDLASPLSPHQPGQNRLEREVLAHKADGNTFPALQITSISPAPDGQGYSETHLIHDLSDLKAMQDALQHGANLAFLGRMSASLVHEISQPMNVIRLTAEGTILKLERSAVDPADIKAKFQTISDQAARLFETIEFMQKFSRHGAPNADSPALPSPSHSSFDIGQSLQEAMSVLRLGLQQAQITLTLDRPSAPCFALGHARQIEQVLINLLNNAFHAVSAAQVPHPHIRAALARWDEQTWCVTIDDNGPGIPPATAAHIFEPFFTTKPQGQGTGLGLTISLEIARAAGGDLSYAPSAMGGACFSLRLRCAQTPCSPKPSSPPPRPQEAPQTAHVLVVDNETPSRRSLSQALSLLGYQVSEAEGGWEALSILAQGAEDNAASKAPIDGVITDLRMPNGDGVELLAALAQDYPHLFTIVVTGQSRQQREDFPVLHENCDAILPKPVSLTVLAQTLALFYAPTEP